MKVIFIQSSYFAWQEFEFNIKHIGKRDVYYIFNMYSTFSV